MHCTTPAGRHERQQRWHWARRVHIEDRSSMEQATDTLEERADKHNNVAQHYLLRIALEALNEREPVEEIFEQLSNPDAKVRAQTLHILTRRARKAFMGRIPGGPLVL